MSKINTHRFINITYDTNVIYDETFRYNSLNSLLSLANGGGKSVLVQMACAPYIRASKRNFGMRPFSDFFKIGNAPSVILSEWSLDGNNGYVLVGMIVKKVKREMDDEDVLNVTTFIHEYSEENPFDINNIPLIKKDKDKMTVLDYRTMLSTLNNCPSHKIDVFDLNSESAARRYYRKLSEYGIYEKEWVSIIKQINADESGLAKFFDSESTVKSLLVKRFLPAVNDKLNDEVDNIEGFREDILRHSEIIIKNEEKLDFKNAVHSFDEYSRDIISSANDVISVKEKLNREKVNLEFLRKFIGKTVDGIDEENRGYESLIEDSNYKIIEVDYERASKEYHKIYDDKQLKESELSALNDENEALEDKKAKIKRDIVVQNALREKNDIEDLKKENLEYMEHIKNSKRSDSEKENEVNNIEYSLKELYLESMNSSEDKISSIESLILDKTDKKDRALKKITSLREDKDVKNKEKGAVSSMIKSFNDMEDVFASKYKDFNVVKNIMGSYKEDELESYKESITIKIDNLKEKYDKNNKAISQNEDAIQSTLTDIQVLRDEGHTLSQSVKEVSDNLNKYYSDRKNLVSALQTIGIGEEDIFAKEKNIAIINNKINHIEEEKYILKTQLDKLTKERTMYLSGENIELPESFLKSLSRKNVDIVYGFEWLKNQSHMSYEDKCEYVRKNPLLPYSILVNASDYEILIKDNADVFVEFPVPILRRDSLVKNDRIETLNGIIEEENYSLYVAFNTALLDEDKLKAILNKIAGDISKIESLIRGKNQDIQILNESLVTVMTFDYSEDYESNLKNEEIRLRKKIDVNDEETASKEEFKTTLQSIIKGLDKDNKDILSLLHKLDIKLMDTVSFIDANKHYEDNRNSLRLIEDSILNIEDNISEKSLEVDTLLEEINLNKAVLVEEKRVLSVLNDKYVKIPDNTSGCIVEGTMDELETRLEVLKSEIGFETAMLEKRMSENNIKIDRAIKSYENIVRTNNLSESDFNDVVYDLEKISELSAEEVAVSDDISKKIKKITTVSGKVEVLSDRLRTREKECIKLAEKLGLQGCVKSKGDIGEYDFEAKKRQLTSDIEFAKKSIAGNKKTRDTYMAIINQTAHYVEGLIVPEESIQDFGLTVENIFDKKDEIIKNINYFENATEHNRKILSESCSMFVRDFKYSDLSPYDNVADKILSEDCRNEYDIVHLVEAATDAGYRLLHAYNKALDDVKKEEDGIVSRLYEYALIVHKEISDIDKNSKIYIGGKNHKMLRIEQPERERILELSARDFLNNVASQCVVAFKNGKSGEDVLKSSVTSTAIYDAIIGLDNVSVTIMKIKENGVTPLSWSEVCKNSGGEGFVSSFIIVSSLLSYMRKKPTDIGLKEEGKVLIMDNPFGKTSSKHLLIPMMEIAKKYNTQLICLSDIGKSDIYDRFDRIFALKLLESSLDKNKRVLKVIDNNDDNYENVMTSSHFETERYEQEMLF